jgi:hypothetical protein
MYVYIYSFQTRTSYYQHDQVHTEKRWHFMHRARNGMEHIASTFYVGSQVPWRFKAKSNRRC